jgi:hypothetical protein
MGNKPKFSLWTLLLIVAVAAVLVGTCRALDWKWGDEIFILE